MQFAIRNLKLLFILLLFNNCFGQSVGIGTNSPHNSAILDVQSNSKGMSIPSLSTTQRNGIVNPKAGLLVYDTDKNSIFMSDGNQWFPLQFALSDAAIPAIIRSAPDGEAGDQFGYCVDIDGSYAVIGAPYDSVGANDDQGSIYIFYHNGISWSQQAKLTATDGGANDRFGNSVAISGSYVITGAYRDDAPLTNQGSAYIFYRNGSNWTEQAKLTASDAAAFDEFGNSVSISGVYAVVGVESDDVNGNNSQGSAFVFMRNGSVWTQQDHIFQAFGGAANNFGSSVDISGDYLVVGADMDDVSGLYDAGSAHVFIRSGSSWNYQFQLTSPGGAREYGYFGRSVGIDGSFIIIGEPGTPNPYVGAFAHIFNRVLATWNHQETLYVDPSPGPSDNAFGFSVSISGDYAMIGAIYITVNGNQEQGASYIFKRSGHDWLLHKTITDGMGDADDLGGYSVGISGFNTITGAVWANAAKGKVFFQNIE